MGRALFFVYILRSVSTGRFYVGQTDNLLHRFHQHASGGVRSTKGYRPLVMIHWEAYGQRADALRRERELKRKKSADSLRRVVTRAYAATGLATPPIG